LPNKLEQLREECERSVGDKSGFGVEGLVEQAGRWEAAGEHAKAVEAFVRVAPGGQVDREAAARCWLRACDLAHKFLSEHRAQGVAQVVGPRLVELGKASVAAELYLKVSGDGNAVGRESEVSVYFFLSIFSVNS
jgi:hypothetical protein